MTIFAPDGEWKLIRAHRGTRGLFTNAADMAARMNEFAKRYPVKKPDEGAALPVTLNARLGLEVAAADASPLLAVVAADDASRAKLEAKVAELAWSNEFIGRFTYATAARMKELANVGGITIDEGVLLIEPDTFGQKGRVVKQLAADTTADQLASAMRATLTGHKKVAKDMREHRFQGMKAGAFWETKLPVTDREEAQARERTRQEMQRRKPPPQ